MSAPPILVASGLSKKYCPQFRRALAYGVRDVAAELLARPVSAHGLRPGEFWALDGVSFELAAGDSLAVVGHNGAGKSTLLKILSGLIKPDRGSARIRGRTCALLALGTEFNPLLTGRENILVGAAVHGLGAKEAHRLIDEVIEFAEIEDFIDAPVRTYSAGMKSRLAYAMTAQLKPDLLLVDEVLAVGDHAFQRKCVSHMLSFIAQGGSLVFVSHSAHQIQAVCRQGLLLDHGRPVFSGTSTETLQRMFDSRTESGRPTGGVFERFGPVAIEDFAAENPEGEFLRPNAPMRVTLSYRCEEPVTIRWGFTIWTSDQWVCVTGARDPGERAIEPGSGTLTCLVPRLPLLPGHYRVRPAINDAATTFPIAAGRPDGSYFDIEVRSAPDPEINARRQIGQLVTLDVDWG